MGDDELRERIGAATLRCIARWGLSKTTLEDVAREAGCGRATIYRTFDGGKRELVAWVLDREARRFRTEVETAIAAAQPPADLEVVVAAGVVAAAHFLETHGALRYLLDHEPDLVLPFVGFHRMGVLFELVGEFAAPHLAPFITDPTEARRAAEWLARVVLLYVARPVPGVDLADPVAARHLLCTYVIPGLRRASTVMEEQCPAMPS